MLLNLALSLFLLLGFIYVADAQAQSASTNASGKVVSLRGPELIVGAPNGDVKVIMGDKTVVRGEVPIMFSEITSGMYVGVMATKQPDGTFLASRVNVFSEDQRGTGEGHRPLDSAPDSGATMTNANVERVEDVAVRDVKARMMNLKYKGGEINVLVPPETPVSKRVVGDRSLIKIGSEVSVAGTQDADGSLSARQVTVRAPKR
jgi:uncharacterized protein DUF5666